MRTTHLCHRAGGSATSRRARLDRPRHASARLLARSSHADQRSQLLSDVPHNEIASRLKAEWSTGSKRFPRRVPPLRDTVLTAWRMLTSPAAQAASLPH